MELSGVGGGGANQKAFHRGWWGVNRYFLEL